MPSPEAAWLNQETVLWSQVGYDIYGRPTIGSPIQILARWNLNKQQWIDAKGNEITLDATVIVDRDIPIGSQMWLGSIDDWIGTAFVGTGTSESIDEMLMEVVGMTSTLDIKGRLSFRQAKLMRLRNLEV